MWGALLGAGVAGGLILVGMRLAAIRRPQLGARVLPFVRDLPQVGRTPGLRVASPPPTSAMAAVFGPSVQVGARAVERLLGGSASVARRLERAGLDDTVHDFRVRQVFWGLVGFGVAAAVGVVRSLADPGNALPSVVLCGLAVVFGVVACDSRLSSLVSHRERAMLVEFPTLAELLALSVAAGESPVAALARVVRRSGGELSRELGGVLAAVRTGTPVGVAFDRLAASTGVPLVARFADGISVAVERGTPLADVLHAQAADVREAGRRELIESAARKEVFMMVPVVFLVLPVTVAFAFWPGVIGLSLTTP
jgi:tight adherence protein C